MKKKIGLLIATVLITTLPFVASAAPHEHYKDYAHEEWHEDSHHDVAMPFKWHEHRENFAPEHHKLERIHDREFRARFEGLHPYRWHGRHGEEFIYHGRHIHDAVFFYNDADELISIGFMHEGVFIRVSADNREVRSHDSFFVAWMRQN